MSLTFGRNCPIIEVVREVPTHIESVKKRCKVAVHYPVEFPFDSAREAVRIFKAGTIMADKALLGEAVWNLQGYAQLCLLGEAHTIYKSTPPATDEEVIAMLEEFDKGATADPDIPRIKLPFDASKLLEWALKIAAMLL